MKYLKELNEKALQNHIAEIKSAPKGSKIIEANQHLLNGGVSKTWAGAGELTLGGFIWWTADCNLALTDFSTGVKAVNFSASGTGVLFGAVEAEVVGAFVVDPSTIGGSCHFTIAVGAVEEGAATLFLYSTSGKFYGNFTGPAEGAAAGSVSGSGKLKVVPA